METIKCFKTAEQFMYFLCLEKEQEQEFQSAGCLTNCHVASTHQHLAQNFNRPAPTALPRFCYLCTKIWNVRKSQV